MAKSPKHRRWLWLLLLIVALAGYGWWAANRSLPALQPLTHLKPNQTSLALPLSTPDGRFNWPGSGQAAVAVVGSSNISTHGLQTPIAMASTAKLITALTVLHKKPLTSDLSGPVLTLSAADVALYRHYQSEDGSVVPVFAGEQISEYQVLQAMLLPSANNLSDSLATWAFGSLSAYSAYANSYVKQLGLHQTHIGSDASGFLPDSTTTASDLAHLGQLVMQQPVLKQIVSQTSATGLPGAGTITNVNRLLGQAGIVGIKTGNNDQDPGVFLGAATVSVTGHPVTVVTALLGSPSLWQAMSDSLSLVESAETNFATIQPLAAGAVVGDYRLPWGGTVTASLPVGLKVTVWSGEQLTAHVHLQPIPASASAGRTVGQLTTDASLVNDAQSLPIRLNNTPTTPSLWWRLTHPF